ncbi:MAG: dTDP-4-dehydrorhamnose 3,5-epimerase family protein [Deltaproteobacteria bacterium]|nr:dTDP-4-dehydrorhamnose 3,5-epimerase family protein [Deltaproteobacteria bacterium]
MNLPGGAQIIYLKEFADLRGFFRELIKVSWKDFQDFEFAQISHSFMKKNVVKAWHYHKYQTDWWYVVAGKLKVALIDFRSGIFGKPVSFILDATRPAILKIPPLVIHGVKTLSSSAHLVYLTDKEYNPADEGRIPFNDARIKFFWGKKVIVSENDKKEFLI